MRFEFYIKQHSNILMVFSWLQSLRCQVNALFVKTVPIRQSILLFRYDVCNYVFALKALFTLSAT